MRILHKNNVTARYKSDFTAFTLAEVLITLGIIGIVAAMTVPVLLQNYQKKTTVTRLKQDYATVLQGIRLSEIDNGPVNGWDTDLPGHDFFEKYLKDYFRSPKEISKTDLAQVSPRKLLNGGAYTGSTYSTNYDDALMTNFLLSNGSMITFNRNGADEMWVVIDVDGLGGHNTIGKDTFMFVFTSTYGLQPLGGKGSASSWLCEDCTRDDMMSSRSTACNKKKMGYWCAMLIMNDNWEIKDDYPW